MVDCAPANRTQKYVPPSRRAPQKQQLQQQPQEHAPSCIVQQQQQTQEHVLQPLTQPQFQPQLQAQPLVTGTAQIPFVQQSMQTPFQMPIATPVVQNAQLPQMVLVSGPNAYPQPLQQTVPQVPYLPIQQQMAPAYPSVTSIQHLPQAQPAVQPILPAAPQQCTPGFQQVLQQPPCLVTPEASTVMVQQAPVQKQYAADGRASFGTEGIIAEKGYDSSSSSESTSNARCPFYKRKILHLQPPNNADEIAAYYASGRDWFAQYENQPTSAPVLWPHVRNLHVARGMANTHKSLQETLCFKTPIIPNFNFLPFGVQYTEDFLTPQEEHSLFQRFEREEWDTELTSRRTIQYGYHFDYNTDNLGREDRPIPEWLTWLVDRVTGLGTISERPNQIIVNEYEPKQGIALHSDRHCFGEYICSVSLGSDISMAFVNSGDAIAAKYGASKGHSILLKLKARSILCMTSQARWKWQHGIAHSSVDFDDNFNIVKRGKRISLTFRYVDPNLWAERNQLLQAGHIDPKQEKRIRDDRLRQRRKEKTRESDRSTSPSASDSGLLTRNLA